MDTDTFALQTDTSECLRVVCTFLSYYFISSPFSAIASPASCHACRVNATMFLMCFFYAFAPLTVYACQSCCRSEQRWRTRVSKFRQLGRAPFDEIVADSRLFDSRLPKPFQSSLNVEIVKLQLKEKIGILSLLTKSCNDFMATNILPYYCFIERNRYERVPSLTRTRVRARSEYRCH